MILEIISTALILAQVGEAFRNVVNKFNDSRADVNFKCVGIRIESKYGNCSSNYYGGWFVKTIIGNKGIALKQSCWNWGGYKILPIEHIEIKNRGSRNNLGVKSEYVVIQCLGIIMTLRDDPARVFLENYDEIRNYTK